MSINKSINSVQTTDRFIATVNSQVHIPRLPRARSHRIFTDQSLPPPLFNIISGLLELS